MSSSTPRKFWYPERKGDHDSIFSLFLHFYSSNFPFILSKEYLFHLHINPYFSRNLVFLDLSDLRNTDSDPVLAPDVYETDVVFIKERNFTDQTEQKGDNVVSTKIQRRTSWQQCQGFSLPFPCWFCVADVPMSFPFTVLFFQVTNMVW